jgi:outer membrane protein OmpA-like peptidoglycan-associated protein
MMKKAILMSAILTMGTATSAVAAPVEMSDEAKRDTVIWGSLVTGAVAGGPLGAMVGVIAGSWLGEKIEAAGQVEDVEDELARARAQANELSQQLAEAEMSAQSYQQHVYKQIALEQLQLELLFKTGVSELTVADQLKMSLLASLLVEHPELKIRLDGHADPRGDESYNQSLTDNRVQSVQDFLIAKGVAAERFTAYSHGASLSSAIAGDYDSYALERVVKVQLSSQIAQDSVAQASMP